MQRHDAGFAVFAAASDEFGDRDLVQHSLDRDRVVAGTEEQVVDCQVTNRDVISIVDEFGVAL